MACSNDMGVSRLIVEELLIEPFRDRLLKDKNFLDAVSALKNSGPKNGSLVYEPDGARRQRDSGGRFYGGLNNPSPDAEDDWLTEEGAPPDALLAAKLAAIESAAGLSGH